MCIRSILLLKHVRLQKVGNVHDTHLRDLVAWVCDKVYNRTLTIYILHGIRCKCIKSIEENTVTFMLSFFGDFALILCPRKNQTLKENQLSRTEIVALLASY